MPSALAFTCRLALIALRINDNLLIFLNYNLLCDSEVKGREFNTANTKAQQFVVSLSYFRSPSVIVRKLFFPPFRPSK
jgi:hypothetical protein